MLLDKRTIQKREIIRGGDVGQYRVAGYDLTVGKIISKDGKEVEGASYVLQPHGGMAEAISAEFLDMPGDTLAYATQKTSVSRDAVLAMRVGIVDPGYRGLISTTLINFSKQPYVLHKGRPFLRLSFHRVRPTPLDVSSTGVTNDEYVRSEIDKAMEHFAESSFLDIEKVAEKSAADVFKRYTNTLFVWFPAILLILAVLTFILNFVAPRYSVPPDRWGDVKSTCEEMVDRRVNALEQRLTGTLRESGGTEKGRSK